jgi:mono/diheme cytochrome c family protein
MSNKSTTAGLLLVLVAMGTAVADPEAKIDTDAAARGYKWLTDKVYLPSDFDQETIENSWKAWPKRIRKLAESATPAERNRMIYERYGLSPRPNDPSKPLQYVVSDNGVWTMNCFACHGGEVNGTVIPGLPNANYELETLTEEVRLTKLMIRKRFSNMDAGSLVMPLGGSRGLTNAVMFGVALMRFRDDDLNIHQDRSPPRMIHHDMDPPPWWNTHKKKHLYIDGFAEKSARSLMPFMLVLENGPDKFRLWESDFEDVFAYIESLRAPKYPFPIDEALAADGKQIFNNNCAECHGTYAERDEDDVFPGKVIPIDEIGTDPVRLTALDTAHRKAYGSSWFAHYGTHEIIIEPKGYVAPPLDGVWASAPYFHNGSVPSLWEVLNPDDRPVAWKRTMGPFDRERNGLSIERLDAMPKQRMTKRLKRLYFDTKAFGKSNAGHDYPNALDADEKKAVFEYLKTL